MTHEQALKDYIKATNTHQFENVKRLLHQKAVYWFTDKTCMSIKEIQDYFENSWNTIKNEIYSISDIQWLVVESNTATCIYTFHYEGFYNNSYISGSGRATNVFIKDKDNRWKLIHEHLSNG